MPQFMVESPHSEDECMKMLDEAVAMGDQALAQWHWGCMAGDHTGYAMIEASSEDEVKRMIPSVVRSKAKIIPVQTFTAEQIQSFHSH
jgi:hypothetical protein